jgi:hypothetical protein
MTDVRESFETSTRAREHHCGMSDSPNAAPVEVLPARRLAAVPTPLKRRAIDLATMADVRREMSRVYRDMRAGRIETADGSRLVYVLWQMAKLIELAELQPRLEAIERAMRDRSRESP